jgi:uncharacterized membrane protein YqaE (UPF0057 family)
MSNLTIAFLLPTLSVWLVGAGIIFDSKEKDYGISILMSALIFVPSWWGLYFFLLACGI